MRELRYKIYQDIQDNKVGFAEADSELAGLFEKEQKIPQNLFDSAIKEARNYWDRGKKKKAIKIIRTTTGMGLKQCKLYCEDKFK